MSIRRIAAYTVALAAAGIGLWLFTSEPKTAPSALVTPASAPTGAVTVELSSGQTPTGGYRGTGRKQVTLEGDAKQVAGAAHVEGEFDVKTPQQLEGERRQEDLKRVLENIQGEPVYVEGVDGPVPPKPEKKTK